MLRWLVVLMLLANLGYWAWHQPAVGEALGRAPAQGRDPGRLAQQVRPEAIRIHTGPVVAPPPSCLQAGPLDEAAYATALDDLRDTGVPEAAWVDIRRGQPGRWAVYMGPYADTAQRQRKLDELQRRRLALETLDEHPTLSPGLVLGQFGSEAEARRRLDELQNRGIRTARVEKLAESTVSHQLRAEGLQVDQSRRLQAASRSVRWAACPE